MSGRFALFRWTPALAALPGFPADHQPHWNLAPGGRVLMLRELGDQRRADMARWGLTPAWLTDLSKTPAHARVETLADQPMFREAFRSRRCLILANGFYEWRGVRKRPYWVSAEGGIMYFAALWEAYPVGGMEYLSLAMVTQPVADLRRPLVLDEEGQRLWLAADSTPMQLLELLARPGPQLRERPLANLVNDPKLDGPECLTPA
ncbi:MULTISPECIES: SOS response-associated peptidase [Pseudomonas]|uniref:SOS response-associated peptidase n=1 Tax=Pseudomonadaceae TaxID=135621 RepID=UPI0003FD2718|nr:MULTISPECIES: SOS response-associated peptidase [Pseudomonas]MDE3735655.1 SOS response-associated peptidase [Pseudomonas resinovorans]MDH4583279.1 SOS response-associated peptidase [Pseudomonas sp. BN415]